MAPQMPGKQFSAHSQWLANFAGLAFIVLGVAMIVIAGIRFVNTAKNIEIDTDVPSPGNRFDLALAALIGRLGIALFLYMARAVLPSL
jgi:uncharacterized membrane protein YidH (DUF202 family)